MRLLLKLGSFLLAAPLAFSATFLTGPFVPGSGNYTLVPNGDFESDIRPTWIHFANDHDGNFINTTEQAYAGNQSAKAVPEENFTGYGWAEYQVAPLIEGERYVLSGFFLRTHLPALYIDMFDIFDDPEVRPPVNPDEWQFGYKEFIAPPGTLGIRLVFDGGPPGSGEEVEVTPNDTGYLDNIAITLASEFVPPTVAPKPVPDAGSGTALALGLALGAVAFGRRSLLRS